MKRGFTIIECLFAIILVGFMFVTALQAASTSATAQYKAAERATARYLAQGLMTEIMQKNYEEAGLSVPFLGVDVSLGELASQKSSFDDVDDYNGWSESPPQDPNGTALSGFSTWSRSVVVEWVLPTDPTTTSTGETGVKRITISVYHQNIRVAKLIALKGKNS